MKSFLTTVFGIVLVGFCSAGTPKPVAIKLAFDPYFYPTGRNIVQNPGFENTMSWTVTGNCELSDVSSGRALRFNAGQSMPNAVVSQTLITVPGRLYYVSFDYGTLAFKPLLQAIEVTVAGASQLFIQRWVSSGTTNLVFSHISFTFTANSTSTALSFKDVSPATDSTDSFLDNVLVMPSSTTGTFTVYKSTSLGRIASPWKKTAILPWTKSEIAVTVLPGTWYFRATASTTTSPEGNLIESAPSNTITNIVKQ